MSFAGTAASGCLRRLDQGWTRCRAGDDEAQIDDLHLRRLVIEVVERSMQAMEGGGWLRCRPPRSRSLQRHLDLEGLAEIAHLGRALHDSRPFKALLGAQPVLRFGFERVKALA